MKEYLVFFALMSLSVETTTVLPTKYNGALQSHVLQLEQTVSNLQSQSQVQEQKYAAVLSNILSKLTTTTDELTGVKTELSGVKKELGSVNTEFENLKKDYQSLQNEFNQLRSMLYSKDVDILRLRTDFNASETKLLSSTHNLTLSLYETKSDLGSLKAEVLNRTASKINALESQTDEVYNGRLKALETTTSILSTNLSSIHTEIESVKTSMISLTTNLTSTVDTIKRDVTLLKADTDESCSADSKSTPSQQSHSATKCPIGFIDNGHSCYLFSRTTATFAEANSICHYFSSRLAVITSKDEDEFIRRYLQKNGQGHTYFIGGSDLRQEGIWTWTCSDRNMTYTNWGQTQPDNHFKVEHCLSLGSVVNYQWNDDVCDHRNQFVCERKL